LGRGEVKISSLFFILEALEIEKKEFFKRELFLSLPSKGGLQSCIHHFTQSNYKI